MKYYLKYAFAVSLASLLAFSLPACSDDDAGDTSSQQEEPDPEGQEPTDPKEKDEPEEPEQPKEEPDEGWQALLLAGMATDLEVANKGTTRLSVMLVSLHGDDAGEGMVGKDISWKIKSGKENINLSSGKSKTGEGGIATIDVYAKDLAGSAVVTATTTENLAPKSVSFNVKVLDKPTGNINATASINGNAPAANYAIRLYDGKEVQCAYVDLEAGSIPNIKTDTEATPLFPAVDAKTALFENLSTEMNYTLIAYAYSAEGAPVAAGCLDSGLTVRGSETTEAVIPLQTIALDPVTTYHIRSYFDLGDVASALGSVGTLITRITDFAADPGATLYDLLWDLIKEGVGGTASIIEKLVSLLNLDEKLTGWINDTIQENKTVCTVGLFACQFRDLVRMMEFMGELNVEKLGDVELQGTDAYDGIAAYWRMNCDGSDPNCGRMPLTTKQLNITDTINFLEGGWSGSIANGYDKLAIESHELSLYYGKIVIYLITQVLIPKVTKDKVKCSSNTANAADCFTNLIAYWVNCDSIGKKLFDALDKGWLHTLGINVSQSQATGWCKSAASGASSILGFLTAFAELQKAGSDIIISGTAKFSDTNADNVVDIISNGNWAGSMNITLSNENADGTVTKTTQTTGVKGIWSAYNLKNVNGEDGNIYCTNPKTSTDSADQLCSYPLIDRNQLNSAGMCAKYVQCAK